MPGYLGLSGDHSAADCCGAGSQGARDIEYPESEHNDGSGLSVGLSNLPQQHGTTAGDAITDDELKLIPEAHIALFEECGQKKVFTRGQRKQINKDLADVKISDLHLWQSLRAGHRPRTLPKGCRTFLLEIFAGTALLTMMLLKLVLLFLNPSIAFDGTDLCNPKHRDMIDNQIARDDPYAISLSPVCTAWSPWQDLNVSKSEETRLKIDAERSRWYPALKWMANLIRQRLAKGRQVVFEQPWPSHMWYTLVLQRLLHDAPEDVPTGEPLEAIRCDQCEFGLADWDTGIPHKKSTGIMTASHVIKTNMNVQCSGNHSHVQLAGGQRTRRAQQWPQPFCQAILDGLCEDLDLITTKVAFPAEVLAEENPLGALDQIFDSKDEVADFQPVGRCDELEIKQEEGREQGGPGQTQQDQLRKRERLKLPLFQRVAIRRLHQMTGQASVSAMARMLRLGRADPEMNPSPFEALSMRSLSSTPRARASPCGQAS